MYIVIPRIITGRHFIQTKIGIWRNTKTSSLSRFVKMRWFWKIVVNWSNLAPEETLGVLSFRVRIKT